MKLDRVVLVNWGQLTPADYEFGNMSLLTGPTGAGKSTMLDGIQTIMTAAYPGIVSYNPGQDEVQQGPKRGKSKRTLESFAVGAEYSLFSRPDGAQCYAAAVFRPSSAQEPAKLFTALIAASAHVEGVGERRQAKLERLEMVIVEDAALSYKDFLKDEEANEWIAVDQIVRNLKAKYPKVVAYEQKRDYLSALYGHCRGRNSVTWDEAQHAARAWAQSIAYRPIGSVNELVREDILEFDAKHLQESITRISELMRQVTSLRAEGERLSGIVARLAELKQSIGETSQKFEEQVQYELLLARMRLEADNKVIRDKEREQKEDQEVIGRMKRQVESEKLKRGGLDASRVEVQAKLLGIPAHAEKKELETRLARAAQESRSKLAELYAGLRAAANITSAAEWLASQEVEDRLPKVRAAIEKAAGALAAADMERLAGLLDAVVSANSEDKLDSERLRSLSAAFDGIASSLQSVHEALVGTDESVLWALASEEAALEASAKELQSEQRELAARKERLAAGAGNYDRHTGIAVERIRERYPQAGVQVLCDLVEPRSQQWQPAIEGYMDGARFNLIVKPEWEAKTIDFLETFGSRSKVVQGKRCLERAGTARVPPESIIHELHTEHPIAKAYLIEQFGSVVKVKDSEELRHTARGLTISGKGSGSRTMFVGEKRELVFGRAARENALKQVEDKLEACADALAEVTRLRAKLKELKGPLAGLHQPGFDATILAAHASEMEQAQRSLAQLDLSGVGELETALACLTAEIKVCDDSIEAANREGGRAQDRIKAADEVIVRVNAGKDSRLAAVQHQLQRLKAVCEANPAKTFDVLTQQVKDLQESGGLSVLAVEQNLDAIRSRPETLLGTVREQLAQYNAAAKPEERFISPLNVAPSTTFDINYGPLCTLGKVVTELHQELDGIGLHKNRDKLQQAERSFHDVFTKQFCVEIKSKVDDGVRTLKQLNIELSRLKFGTDRFSIDYSRWVPEFQDYYGFFSAVAELADSPEVVDLFAGDGLSPKHAQVRDNLVKLLLDPDQERASKELLRIADYRNYRVYEIWNDSDSGGRISLSTWGTGSGGQLETPAYIVRAAVVTNRLKLFDKGAALRMLVSDESFSRMDEGRARAVLKYLRDGLGIQVISAMPTRGAGGLRPEFDREFSFSRVPVGSNGELDFLIEVDERVFKQDKMRELWEAQRVAVREQAKLAFEAAEGPEARATS